MKNVTLGAIRLYQRAVSPFWPAACRYEPTCSDYSYQALSRYGFWYGVGLSLLRLSRCRPLGRSGYDPVP